jgi:hypothetical protein
MRRLRFRLWHLTAAVAIATVSLWLLELRQRSMHYEQLAQTHLSRSLWLYLLSAHLPSRDYIIMRKRVKYHEKMYRKWRDAAARPWLLVDADPPPPDGAERPWAATGRK